MKFAGVAVRGGRLSRLIEQVTTLPLAIPGLAIGLALLLADGGFGAFRRSWLFILAGHVVITMPVLLLDEPLTALDAALRDKLRSELDRLLRSLGITSIDVTHDQSEAMALGDRIVVMSNGEIARIGAPREIYFRQVSRFVAEFAGSANILEAEIAQGRLLPDAV